MSDKLRDAAERWSDAIPGISDGDDNWALTSDDYDEAVRIACAYLAEHPADDAKPIIKDIRELLSQAQSQALMVPDDSDDGIRLIGYIDALSTVLLRSEAET